MKSNLLATSVAGGTAFAALSLLLLSTPAHADLNRFAYTYGLWTQTKDGREVEFYHTQPKSGRQWHHQVELEYGVTERYLVAPYVLLDRSGGFSDFPGAEGGGESEEGADFGSSPKITTLDTSFHEVAAPFTNPFPGYGPFNVHALGGHVFVAYAKIEKVGEEEHGADKERLVEYYEAGNTIAIWDDRHLLNATWGIAKAPGTGFGLYSDKLLVSNFGNGSITVFDPVTRQAIDYLRDASGSPVVVPGVWEILFGNGVRLGDSTSLYFAAWPNGEEDGVFGRITIQP